MLLKEKHGYLASYSQKWKYRLQPSIQHHVTIKCKTRVMKSLTCVLCLFVLFIGGFHSNSKRQCIWNVVERKPRRIYGRGDSERIIIDLASNNDRHSNKHRFVASCQWQLGGGWQSCSGLLGGWLNIAKYSDEVLYSNK